MLKRKSVMGDLQPALVAADANVEFDGHMSCLSDPTLPVREKLRSPFEEVRASLATLCDLATEVGANAISEELRIQPRTDRVDLSRALWQAKIVSLPQRTFDMKQLMQSTHVAPRHLREMLFNPEILDGLGYRRWYNGVKDGQWIHETDNLLTRLRVLALLKEHGLN